MGVIFFALHPIDDVSWPSGSRRSSRSIAAIGLVAYATPHVTCRVSSIAYLFVGYAGLHHAAALPARHRGQPATVGPRSALFLVSGAISGYGAHLADTDDKRAEGGR